MLLILRPKSGPNRGNGKPGQRTLRIQYVDVKNSVQTEIRNTDTDISDTEIVYQEL